MKLNNNISTSFKVLIENLDKAEYYIDCIKSALFSGKLSVVTDDIPTFDFSIKQCFSFTNDILSCLYQNGKMLNDIVIVVKGDSHGKQ